MSPVVTLVLGALLYYVAVTGRAEAVYRALVVPAPNASADQVGRFFVQGAAQGVEGNIP